MLMKTSEQKKTVSIAHQGAAAWHYGLAMEAWDEYNHCLDDRGLYHPDFVNIVRNTLNAHHRHCSIADRLMRIRQ